MSERIKAIINFYCNGNRAQFSRAIGCLPQYTNKMMNGRSIGVNTLTAILNAFPDVDARWLVCGTGAMHTAMATDALAREIKALNEKVEIARASIRDINAMIDV